MKSSRSLWELYGFPLVMIAASIVTIVAVARRPDAGTTDFKTFHQSGRQYLAGLDPYVPFDATRGPNLNPPWVVAAMAPLSRAPLGVAVAVWWAVSFICFFASIVLIARAVAPGQVVAIASIVLVTQSAYANLRLGQVAWPLMLLVTSAWLADRSRRPWLCGLLLGVAAAWKPFLLVFAPYLLWRRDWRGLASMAAALAVTVAAGLAFVGAASFSSWIALLLQVEWAGHLLNASIRALVTRALTSPVLVEQPTAPLIVAHAWLDPISLLAVVGVLAAAAWFIVSTRNIDIAWATLTLAALLASPLGWIHYVPIATGPLMTAINDAPAVARRVAVAGWLLLCVPFAWLTATTFGPVATVTVASSYVWGVMLLETAVFLAAMARRE